MPLLASRSIILIDPGDTTGDVTITWDFPFEIQLYERTFKVGTTTTYERHRIQHTGLRVGSYTLSLEPGDVYEVRAIKHDFIVDPTLFEDPMKEGLLIKMTEGWVIVHALQLPSDLLTKPETDIPERVGGTFYRHDIATGSTLTHAIMEIGIDRPVADAAGFHTMPNPIMTVKSFSPTTFHRLTTDSVIFDLLPHEQAKLAEARFALITVFDGVGGWQQVERPFQTLARKLTIDLHTIDVQSLGEPAFKSEAEMRFQMEVWYWSEGKWLGLLDIFTFENQHATLRPFAVRRFVSNPVVTVDLLQVWKETAGLVLKVQEFDDWPFEDEQASSKIFGMPQRIRIQPGEANEGETLNLVVRAWNEDDPFDPEQPIIVDLHVRVKVEHV